MRFQSYKTFWQKIHQSARTRGFPLRVMFELTYRCNFRCRHCYIPPSYRRKREIDTSGVFSVLDQLKDIGCFYLGFTGGEPFVRNDLLKIFYYAKKKGFEIIIYSNGSLINEEIAGQLQRLRPNKVDITIPAMSKSAFERITHLPGSHRKVFRAVDLLHKKGISLGLKTCVLKENESEIEKIGGFAVSLDVPHRLDDMLFARLDGSKEPYKYQGYWQPDCSAGPTVQDREHKTGTDNLFKCGAGVSQMAVTPLAELKMCLMIDYPKFKISADNRLSVIDRHRRPGSARRNHRTDLKTAWNRLKELACSIKPDENYQCHNCRLEPLCRWCPARAWLSNKNFTGCDPQSREWAENRIR